MGAPRTFRSKTCGTSRSGQTLHGSDPLCRPLIFSKDILYIENQGADIHIWSADRDCNTDVVGIAEFVS